MWMDLYNVNQTSSFTKFKQMSSLCQYEVWIFSNTVAVAQIRKINPDQISSEALENVMVLLQMVTNQRNGHPGEISGRPFYEAYVLRVQQWAGKLLFHHSYYLTQPEQAMDNYHYILFPMTMFTSEHYFVLPRPGHHNVLAINKKQEYQVLSSAELHLRFKLWQCTTIRAAISWKTTSGRPAWGPSSSKMPKPPPGTAISRSNPRMKESSKWRATTNWCTPTKSWWPPSTDPGNYSDYWWHNHPHSQWV